MSKFIGIKLVDAVVMCAGQARKKGYRVNQDCLDVEVGYGVTYEDGYKSWSPADVFEKYYYMIQDNNASEIKKIDARNFISEFEYIKSGNKIICIARALNNIGFVNSIDIDKDNEDNRRELEIKLIDKVSNRLSFVLKWAKNGLKTFSVKSPVEGEDSDTSTIPPHVQRMMVERDELKDKIIKLDKFIGSNRIFFTLSKEEQKDMNDQLISMITYLDCLERRIARANIG